MLGTLLQAVAILPITRLLGVASASASSLDVTSVAVAGLGIFLLYVGATAFAAWSRRRANRLAKAVTERLRLVLLDKVLRLDRSAYQSMPASALRSALVESCERVDEMTVGGLVVVVPAIVTSAVVYLAMVAVSPLMAAAVIPAMVLLGAAAVLRRRGVLETSRVHRDAVAALDTDAAVILDSMDMVRSAGATSSMRRRLGEHIGRLRQAGTAYAEAVQQVIAGQTLFSAGLAIGAVVVGVAVLRYGLLDVRGLIAFVVLLALFRGALGGLVSVVPQVVAGYAALGEVHRIWNLPDERTAHRRPSLEEGLQLDGVEIVRGGRRVLGSVTAELRRGEHAAVIGPNGAGKTSLLTVVAGLQEPSAGRLLADGVDYAELDPGVLRGLIGLVPQDPQLVPGTILENVVLGREVPDATLQEALEASGLTAAAARLGGLDTRIGPGDVRLSGGERQRIAIARALAGAPSLLLLDEPMNNLDASGTAALIAMLSRLSYRPAVLLVAHDERLVEGVDAVWLIDNGVVSVSRR